MNKHLNQNTHLEDAHKNGYQEAKETAEKEINKVRKECASQLQKAKKEVARIELECAEEVKKHKTKMTRLAKQLKDYKKANSSPLIKCKVWIDNWNLYRDNVCVDMVFNTVPRPGDIVWMTNKQRDKLIALASLPENAWNYCLYSNDKYTYCHFSDKEKKELTKLSELNGPVPKKYRDKITFDDFIAVKYVAHEQSTNEVHITLCEGKDSYWLNQEI